MKFTSLILFGILCTTLQFICCEDIKKDSKIINKKATTNEKKALEKKTLDKQPLSLDSLSSASSLDSVTPVPSDSLLEIGTPESVTYPSGDVFNITWQNATKESNDIVDQRYFLTEMITDPIRAKSLWVDLNSLPKHQVFKHDVLSESHRRAASIMLPFKFPFYGQNLTKATIATGGFLYMGDHIHSWLAATQYVAPLMAHFDTRDSNQSNILYGYNSSLFVIQWEKVNLIEKNNTEFTFQCVLYKNGNIAFVYKDIPIPIQDISDDGHPVKIGVSDAYFIQRSQVYVRRKTIYEYHKVDMINSTIGNNTAIFLTAKLTCIALKTCNECVTTSIGFDCSWCAKAQRCSDGFDRKRQDWIADHCDLTSINNSAQCAAPIIVPSVVPVPIEPEKSGSNTNNKTTQPTNSPSDHIDKHFEVHDDGKNVTELSYNTQVSPDSGSKRIGPNSTASAHWAARFMLFFTLIGGIAFWILYAYRNPTTPSGQLLIRWRPSHWRWVYPETRYTAASIHM